MFVLGIDIGTTGTKAILVDENGKTLKKGYKGYSLITPGEDRVEQDARDWWKAVVYVVREVCTDIDTNKILALSLSTQGASSLLVDNNFNPLTNAITWMDKRGQKEKEELLELFGDDYFYYKTGWRLSESLDVVKLKWLRKNEHKLLKKAACFASTLEYINYRLTGNNIIDPSNAAIRQLMNLSTLKWDCDILDILAVDEKQLPKIISSGEYIGQLKTDAAEELGLSKKLKVYNGAHDQYCSCLGANITKRGEIMLSTGTAWVLMPVFEKPLFTRSYISPAPHIVSGLWGAIASLPYSGAALDWFMNRFTTDDYDTLNKNAKDRTYKIKNTYFYPYFSGAAFPLWQPNAKAAFLGFGLEHDKYDAALAIMEAVAFQMRMAMEEFVNSSLKITTMKILGGALKSTLWTSIITNNIDCEVYAMTETDTACVGAAAIAGVGVGIFENYNSATQLMNKPIRLNFSEFILTDFYKEKYERYKNVWKQVSKLYI